MSEIKKRSEIIDSEIKRLMPIEEPKQLYEAARYLLDAGGKRLRPVILMLSADVVGGDSMAVLPASVSVELVHNFSLMHDDIMDNDKTRRGVRTAHTKWDVPLAILAGDAVFSKSFEILAHSNGKGPDAERVVRCIEMLANSCIEICKGQYMDMSFSKLGEVSESEYFKMIDKKTGALFATCAAIGGLLGGGSEEDVSALWNYGVLLGRAFQIYDDVLDLTTPTEVLGKDRGSDLIEGKKTIVAIHAMSKGLSLPLPRDATEKDVDVVIDELHKMGSINYANNKARTFADEAKSKLDGFSDSDSKDLLLKIVDYTITRKY